jgi:metal-responsive CopG/Arc/MetJ family transcriptional regulator
MSSVRINISLPQEIMREITQKIEPRKRSRFITEAIVRSLKEQRNRSLAAEYEEAAAEIKRLNQEMEGTLSDGLD